METKNDLIHREWHTEAEGLAENGELRFGGFYGDYEVEARTPDGRIHTETVRLCKDTTGFDNRLCDFRRTDIVL